MNTSGTSREHLLILVPALVLVCFAVFVLGGPASALDTLNRTLADLWDAVWGWLSAVV